MLGGVRSGVFEFFDVESALAVGAEGVMQVSGGVVRLRVQIVTG